MALGLVLMCTGLCLVGIVETVQRHHPLDWTRVGPGVAGWCLVAVMVALVAAGAVLVLRSAFSG